MNRFLLIIVLLLNGTLLVWGAKNYYYLSHPLVNEVSIQILETAELSRQSSQIMKDYTPEQKSKNIDTIINLYAKLSKHLDATKNSHLEAIDALFEDTYLILLISLTNIIIVLYIITALRHNKSLNTGAPH